MEEIAIHPPTAHMKRKMLKREPFRIKYSSSGGAVMLVHKERIPKIHKAFKSSKGHTLTLTDDEIHANGEGIFGKKFDRFLDKHGIKKKVYETGDAFKPFAKAAITAGIMSGATALTGLETFASGGAGAALAPAITLGGVALSGLASDYLDRPSKYQGGKAQKAITNQLLAFGKDQAMSYATQQSNMALNDLHNAGMTKLRPLGTLGTNPYAQLNSYTGDNAGVLGQATGQLALANSMNQQLANAQGFARDALYTAPVLSGGLNAPSVLQSVQLENPLRVNPLIGTPTAPSIQAPNKSPQFVSTIKGKGLHHIVKGHSQSHVIRGEGIKMRHGKLIEKGSIGIHGNLNRTPQALTAAPFAQNFVWSSTLPPAYKRFSATPAQPAPSF